MQAEARPRAGRKLIRTALILATVLIATFVILLAGCQRRWVFLRRSYPPNFLTQISPDIVKIDYKTSSGAQKAYYLKPLDSPEAPPKHVWVLFGGNGSLALGWINDISSPPDPNAGYFLFDYPGYGCNEGNPTRASLIENSLAAFDALAAHLKLTRTELASRTGLMCHSMGTAVGLELAVRLDPPPKKIILFAPFTSLYDMAQRVTGWPICCMLLDRFDNEARLAELETRAPRPEVIVYHGDRDEIVPVDMSRQMAAAHAGLVRYREERGMDHMGIISGTRPLWHAAMKP